MRSLKTIGLGVLAAWALACAEPAPDLTPMTPDPAPKDVGTSYLMVAVSGKGSVVSAGVRPELNCTPSCYSTFPTGTRIRLLPTAEPGWKFTGWSGDRDCVDGAVTVEAERRCFAKFEPEFIPHRALHLLIEGGGAVSFAEFEKKAGCDEECIRTWPDLTSVTMVPHPRYGWLFEEYRGHPDCEDGNVTLDLGKLCIAVFSIDLTLQEILTIEVAGPGSVRVDAFPPVETCNRTCARTFARDTIALLSATPDGARQAVFTGWGGDPECMSQEVTLDGPKHCIAYFEANSANINLIGSQGGRLRVEELQADCNLFDDDEPCTFGVRPGSTINVTATPDEGWALSHWLGDCDGQPITVPLHDLSCKAIFRPAGPSCPEGLVDTTPPSIPTGVGANAHDCETATVRWRGASDDGCGVSGYHVYRNGRLLRRTTEASFGLTDAGFLHPGSAHRYQVAAVDAAGNVSALSDVAAVQLPACPKMPSRIDTAMVLFKFPDFANEPASVETMRRQLFNPSGSLSAYVNEVTYGEASLAGDVFGWYVLPQGVDSYCAGHDDDGGFDCNYDMIRADAVRAADADIDFAAYDRVMFAYNDVSDWGGLAGASIVTDEGIVQPMVELAAGVGLNNHVMMHELGHTINRTLHAASWVCSAGPVGFDHTDPLAGGCLVRTYGDFLDPMGGGINHLSAYHKERMGYLDAQHSEVITADGIYRLAALELPSDEVQQLKIPLDPGAGAAGDFYSLEYRMPVGLDLLDRRGRRLEGIVVRLAMAFESTASADTLLPEASFIITAQHPFYDPFRGLLFELVERGGGSAAVRVTGL